MMRRVGIAALLALVAACAPADEHEGVDPEVSPPAPFGLVDCPRPAEGCACEPGTSAIDCYIGPAESPSGDACGAGRRYCRDGSWTACEDIRFITVRTGLIAPGFTSCDLAESGALGCNPDCFVANDSPDPWDLDDSNSTVEIYRSTVLTDPPGVYLANPGTAEMIDSDGDGFHDVGESPECVGAVTATVDSTGLFGCPDGDGIGVYAELPPGATITRPQPLLIPPPPPLDVYVLADLAVLEFDNPLYPLTGPATVRLSLDETYQDLSDNAAAFAAAVEAPYVAQGWPPDVRYGMGYFQEYQGWSHYGAPTGDARAYVHYHDFDPDVAALASALSAMSPALERSGVGDLWDWQLTFSDSPFAIDVISPESQTQALFSIATGSGLPFGATQVPAGPACPAGTWGYPCFRDIAVPVVALIMDGEMHNGPGGPAPIGRYPYERRYAPLVPMPAPTDSGSVKDLTGFGTPGSPYQIPGDASTTWRSYTGSTASGRSNSASSTPCMGGTFDTGNWDGHDETTRFTVSTTTTITVRIERGGDWDGNTRVALYDSGWNMIRCAVSTGTIEWNVELPPGDYRVRVDGARSDGLFGVGAYHVRGSYTLSVGSAPDWRIGYDSHVLPALVDNGVTVVGVYGCSLGTYFDFYDCAASQGRAQLAQLASATGGVDADGNVIIRDVEGGSGGAATAALADAIVSLATGLGQTIRFIPRDDPGTTLVDERAFVAGLSLTAPGCANGTCSPDPLNPGGVVCTPCSASDPLELNVAVFYDPFGAPHPPQLLVPQVFDFVIDVVVTRTSGGTSTDTILRTIPVRIVIPPVYPYDPGSYWRDYDATVFDPSLPAGTPLCSIGGITGLRPDWAELRWDAVTPANDSGTSYIELTIASADALSSLGTATSFCFRIPETAPASASCPAYPASGAAALLDVGAALVAAGSTNYLHLLRATATLHPTPDFAIGPTLYELGVKYVCTPIE
jgi:hypothetical protein